MTSVKSEGIRLKNYCEKCKKTTWSQYITHKKDPKIPIKIDSYYKCEICGTKRLLRNWKDINDTNR